ncbi:glycosyl transferase [Bacillus thuringiensis]|uniref:Glycosyl transferase n=1 Tax=Bacillus thuringiensis TaxID=1428 RepID=A0A9X7C0P4_BACTU|nr:glycosyltransferase [Bacillus thuringiensis]PGH84635.1 glycosyl transferase [Bacillus thuringiensis]
MITISLCMIVRNEEKTLEKCLQSIKGVPDEIILVDTGSTDRTLDIAKKWTNHTYSFSWIDDFSAARNESFRHATKDYILWLDADDILQPEEAEKLQILKKVLDPSIDAVSMLYYVAFDEQHHVTSSTRRIRLVKREKNFRWKGIVHEDLACSESFNHQTSDIIVTHTKQTPRHASRNIHIYKRAMERGHVFTTQDYFHYARELSVHKEYDKAIKMYECCLEHPTDISLENRVFIQHQLATCYALIGNQEKEQHLTLQSFLIDIPQPVFCCRMGEFFIQQRQFEQAIFWYQLAISIKLPNRYEWSLSQQIYQTWLPHKQLGFCYFLLENYIESYKHYQHVLEYQPQDPEVLYNLKLLRDLRR